MMNNNIKSESIKAVPDTVLILTFGNIELEPDSSGFVSFSILPHFGLSDGTEIRNQAGIYFDNNEVVLTNITKNTLYDVPEPDALYTYNHNCSSSGLVYDFEGHATPAKHQSGCSYALSAARVNVFFLRARKLNN